MTMIKKFIWRKSSQNNIGVSEEGILENQILSGGNHNEGHSTYNRGNERGHTYI